MVKKSDPRSSGGRRRTGPSAKRFGVVRRVRIAKHLERGQHGRPGAHVDAVPFVMPCGAGSSCSIDEMQEQTVICSGADGGLQGVDQQRRDSDGRCQRA